MTEYKYKTNGVSTIGLLGILFVTLKLCGIIDWSWWWVTAPFWGPPIAFIAIAIAALIIYIIFKAGKFLINKFINR